MKYIEAVKELCDMSHDAEQSHIRADNILIEYMRDNGLVELADAYERASDRLGFWYS